MEEYHDTRRQTRNDFQRDYDRMIFSSPFRRLQNKTQVFPLPGSIFVHNRLTHSLEVSSVGRSMANEASIMLMQRHARKPWVRVFERVGDIVAAACLCHDIGNPPFGHSGEKTISTWFSEGEGLALKSRLTPGQWSDVVNFEGNANSFRLLTHRFAGRREGGYAMTYSTLASTVKYPYPSSKCGVKGKFGFFETEEEIYRRVAAELGIPEDSDSRFARHPLVALMEAADDICYQIMDIEDAHRLKILTTAEVTELLTGFFDDAGKQRAFRTMSMLDDPNEKVAYLRSNAIGAMVGSCACVFVDGESELLAGNMKDGLVKHMEPRLAEAYESCSRTAWDKIYNAPAVVDVEIAGNRILTYLMHTLMEAVIHPERNFSRLILETVPRQYETDSPDLFTRIQAVLDHISGMTDVYALDLFRKLNAHTLPEV